MVVNHSVSPGCENLGKEVSRMYGYVTFSRVGLELSTSLVETSHLTKAFFFWPFVPSSGFQGLIETPQ